MQRRGAHAHAFARRSINSRCRLRTHRGRPKIPRAHQIKSAAPFLSAKHNKNSLQPPHRHGHTRLDAVFRRAARRTLRPRRRRRQKGPHGQEPQWQLQVRLACFRFKALSWPFFELVFWFQTLFLVVWSLRGWGCFDVLSIEHFFH
jgi:hypothetical protein